MAWTSTQPAALAALVAMFQQADTLAGVLIVDGPLVGGGSEREVLMVGWAGERLSTRGTYPEPEEPEITAALAIEGLSASRSREKYTIRCTVEVIKGASDGLDGARAAAYQIVQACAEVIASDPRLRKTVMLASIGATSYTPMAGPKGAKATIGFGVDIDAFTNR